MQVLQPNFEKHDGLITIVAQDADTREVLMVAFADEAAWRKTLETGLACFFSTSRNKSWTKGEKSGNFLRVVDVLVDCDGDAIIYLVEPQGNKRACHTDARTCFYRSGVGRTIDVDAPKAGDKENLPWIDVDLHQNFLDDMPRSGAWDIMSLEARLKERAKASSEQSYTRKLLDRGPAGCAKKFGEEAIEMVVAAISEDDPRLASEGADVIYHLLVVLLSRGVSFEAIAAELQRREGMSGLAERAARKKE